MNLRDLDRVAVFVVVAVALVLAGAVVFIPLGSNGEPGPTAMLRASIVYVAVVGWQPLVACSIARRWYPDQRKLDSGIRQIHWKDALFAVIVAAFVLGAASIIDVTANGIVARPRALDGLDLRTAAYWLAMTVTVVVILWIQAVAEEFAWRGWMLPRAMEAVGAWRGLFLHGLVWGLSYSPLFAIAGASVQQAAVHVVTYGLLGVVLGWLRLATRSIYASASANAMLTFCGGLPLFLVGEPTTFSSVFRAPGWLPLAGLVALIAWYRPWRTQIATPFRRQR